MGHMSELPNALWTVKEASLEKDYTLWLHSYDIVEMAKLWGRELVMCVTGEPDYKGVA